VSVLFCFVLFCFVLFCFVLFCFVLFCFVLFCFVLESVPVTSMSVYTRLKNTGLATETNTISEEQTGFGACGDERNLV
jgi:hypothetical protein